MEDTALNYAKTHRQMFIDDLCKCLAIPSISTLTEHKKDINACAKHLADHIKDIGFKTVTINTDFGNPIIYADYIVNKNLPTLLFYGHYDVQPIDPIELWDAPPFQPTIKDDYIIARGASDNKGMVYVHLKAIESYLKTQHTLPVNVKFVIEGEEEIGSNGLFEYIKKYDQQLSHDAMVVSDSPMFSHNQPSICTSLRGLIYLEYTIQSMHSDVHSGQLGGGVPNIIHYIANTISKLKDPITNKVLIPGFYNNVLPFGDFNSTSDMATEHLKTLDQYYNLGTHANPDLFNNIWYQPTLDCNGIESGFTEEGAKTVIPNKALLKLSCRLVANQDPKEISQLVQDFIASTLPKNFNITINDFNTHAKPVIVDTDSPYIKKAIQAIKDTHKKDVIIQGEGGSIPIIEAFQSQFKKPIALIGLNAPNDNIHAPNERFHCTHYTKGIETIIRYLNACNSHGIQTTH